MKTILEFQDDGVPLKMYYGTKGVKHDDPQQSAFLHRLECSRKLIENLKVTFSQMCAGDKKYVSPTKVLKSITNDSGEPIELGDQKDIGEFNDSFLSRVQEGLNYKKLYEKMVKVKVKQENKPKDEQVSINESVYLETEMDMESVLESSICVEDA